MTASLGHRTRLNAVLLEHALSTIVAPPRPSHSSPSRVMAQPPFDILCIADAPPSADKFFPTTWSFNFASVSEKVVRGNCNRVSCWLRGVQPRGPADSPQAVGRPRLSRAPARRRATPVNAAGMPPPTSATTQPAALRMPPRSQAVARLWSQCEARPHRAERVDMRPRQRWRTRRACSIPRATQRMRKLPALHARTAQDVARCIGRPATRHWADANTSREPAVPSALGLRKSAQGPAGGCPHRPTRPTRDSSDRGGTPMASSRAQHEQACECACTRHARERAARLGRSWRMCRNADCQGRAGWKFVMPPVGGGRGENDHPSPAEGSPPKAGSRLHMFSDGGTCEGCLGARWQTVADRETRLKMFNSL